MGKKNLEKNLGGVKEETNEWRRKNQELTNLYKNQSIIKNHRAGW